MNSWVNILLKKTRTRGLVHGFRGSHICVHWVGRDGSWLTQGHSNCRSGSVRGGTSKVPWRLHTLADPRGNLLPLPWAHRGQFLPSEWLFPADCGSQGFCTHPRNVFRFTELWGSIAQALQQAGLDLEPLTEYILIYSYKKYFLLSTGNRAADKTDISPYSHGVYILVYILGHRQQDKKGGYTVCQKDLLRRSIKQKRGWSEDRMEWSECPVK